MDVTDTDKLAIRAFVGGIVGLLAAIIVDLDAWADGKWTPSEPFDWAKARRRYVKGIVTGILSGLGVNALSGAMVDQAGV